MKKTALQEIADRLCGYSDEEYFEVTSAVRKNDTVWAIEVRLRNQEQEQEAQNESN